MRSNIKSLAVFFVAVVLVGGVVIPKPASQASPLSADTVRLFHRRGATVPLLWLRGGASDVRTCEQVLMLKNAATVFKRNRNSYRPNHSVYRRPAGSVNASVTFSEKGSLVSTAPFTGTVTKVTSGDHFTVVKTDTNNVAVKCILCGIEAPKTAEAKKALERLILNKKVRVTWQDKSLTQKRTLAQGGCPTYYLVQVATNIGGKQTDVGEEMLRQGYAKHLPEETAKMITNYAAVEKQARQAKVGIWAGKTDNPYP